MEIERRKKGEMGRREREWRREKEVTLGSGHFSLSLMLILLDLCSYLRLFISTDKNKERRK